MGEACDAAGVRCGQSIENLAPSNFSKGKDHALSELKRIAALLNTSALTKPQFDSQNPKVKAQTISRLWGGWETALTAAGLQTHQSYRRLRKVPMSELVTSLAGWCCERRKIPTSRQFVRYCGHTDGILQRRFGGYTAFKKEAIRSILQINTGLETEIHDMLEKHLNVLDANPKVTPVTPHPRGRHLGFRAFAFAPTYEGEVVSLFSSIADELGFEIVAQRPAFPDCEARRITDRQRDRYETCMIEFEFKSRDYIKHKHPIHGCDLIVCWEDTWQDCPIRVLELKSAIQRLSGWK